MEVLLISDGETSSPVADDLTSRLRSVFVERGDDVQLCELRRGDAAPCRGCLLCLTKHPGQCVSRDRVGEIRRRSYLNRKDYITVFITPVVYGHPSSVIKNALDRGTGSHFVQVIIGYGECIDPEERCTFIDITAKHCGVADIVHPGMVREAMAFVTASREESASVCAAIEERL
jgi:hypothetical protein